MPLEEYVVYFEYNNSLNVVLTSALKLENAGTVIALIPCESGIEISKEGIPGPRIFYFRFINNLLYFLIENGITEIYRPLFSDYDYSSPEDQADFEAGLIKRLKERGFVAQEDSNKARLDVNAFSEQYDQGDVDYSLLSKSFADRISNIADKTVEVSYVFSDNKEKNFTLDYHFEDYDAIRKKVIDLIKFLPKEESSNLILKTLFAPAFEAGSEMTGEERDILQLAFSDVLERAAESDNYRLLVRQIGFVIIGSIHCEYRGFENSIECYGLKLDQKSQHFQIKTIRRT